MDLMAEKVDRKQLVDLLKHMLMLDQERRIKPDEALNHPFQTMSHLLDYVHCTTSVSLYNLLGALMLLIVKPVKDMQLVIMLGPMVLVHFLAPCINCLTDLLKLITDHQLLTHTSWFKTRLSSKLFTVATRSCGLYRHFVIVLLALGHCL